MNELWVPVALAFLVGGLVKGAVGLGMPTVVLGALAAYMPVSHAAALLVIPSLVTNVWQLISGPKLWHLLLRLAPLAACLAIGTVIAPLGMAGVDTRLTTISLGAMLIVYSTVGMANVKFTVGRSAEGKLSVLIGLIAGLVNSATRPLCHAGHSIPAEFGNEQRRVGSGLCAVLHGGFHCTSWA